jgi:glutamyl-tRNA reductase
MFFIDIAVPRDIDPKVNDVANVYLYTVDDLNGIVQSNLAQRGKEAEKAEEIVSQEIGQFFKWLSSLDVTPTVVALRSKFEEVRQGELARTLAGWKDLSPDNRKRLEACTSAIINKLLHNPTSVLKRTGQGGRTDLYVDALRQMFELETGGTENEELGDLEE